MQFMVYLAMRADEPMSPPTPEAMAEMDRFMKDDETVPGFAIKAGSSFAGAYSIS